MRSEPVPSSIDRLENFEPGTACRPQPAAENAARDRRVLARLQRCDGLQTAAIFVADRKSIEQIFDRKETSAGEVGCPPRAYTFEVLQRRGEQIVRGRHARAGREDLRYWTIIA